MGNGEYGEGDARLQPADHMALVFLVGVVGGAHFAFVQGFIQDFFGMFLGFGGGVYVVVSHLTTKQSEV